VERTVHEDALAREAGQLSDGIRELDEQTTTQTMNLADLVTVDWGVGAPGSISFSYIDPAGEDSGFTSKGEPVRYFLNESIIEGRTDDGRVIFTFEVLSSGQGAFNLNDQLDHEYGSGDSALLQITNLGQYVQVTVTFGDGTAPVSVPFTDRVIINVENDVPVVDSFKPGAGLRESVFERDLPDGDSDELPSVVFNLNQLVEDEILIPGADEELSYRFKSIEGDDQPSWRSQGEEVQYEVSNNNTLLTAAGKESGTTVFTFELQEGGTATFTLHAPVDNFRGFDLPLPLGKLIEATDTDGDFVSLDGLVTVWVVDDPDSDSSPVVANASGGGGLTMMSMVPSDQRQR
jgi:large repetitive protein